MIRFHITPGNGVPSYRQIMDQVKYHIASGALRSGDVLPSIRDLARQLAVNPSTVVKAYNELGHEGVVEMRHGKGVFVAKGCRKLSASAMRGALRTQARQLAAEARQLGASDDEIFALLREELRKLEGRGKS